MPDSPQKSRKAKLSPTAKRASKSPFPKTTKVSPDRRGFLKAAGLVVAAAMLPRRLAADTDWMDSLNNGGGSSYGGCYNYLGYSDYGDIVGGQPSWDDLMAEIDSGNTMGVEVDWYGGGGHMVVIVGYDDCSDSSMIEIDDWYYGGSYQDYNSFPSQYVACGDWGDTYYWD